MVENSMLEKNFSASDDFIMKMEYQKAIECLRLLCLVRNVNQNRLFIKEMSTLLSDYGNLKNDSIMLPDNNPPSGPCVPGYVKLFVNTDGTFYPCERVNEVSKCMVIGNVEDGYDYKQIQSQINIAQLTADSCINCFAQSHCKICQRQADGGDKLSGEDRMKNCKGSKEDFFDTLLSCAMIYECKTQYKMKSKNRM